MKKGEKKELGIFLIGIGFGILGVFIYLVLSSNVFYQIPYSIQFKINGYTEQNAVAICGGKDLEKTALCLNSFIKGIYNYKLRIDSDKPSFEELVKNGGDCLNYQILTCELGKKMGYSCTKVLIPFERVGNNLYQHTWTVLSNSEGYFELDGKKLKIFIRK